MAESPSPSGVEVSGSGSVSCVVSSGSGTTGSVVVSCGGGGVQVWVGSGVHVEVGSGVHCCVVVGSGVHSGVLLVAGGVHSCVVDVSAGSSIVSEAVDEVLLEEELVDVLELLLLDDVVDDVDVDDDELVESVGAGGRSTGGAELATAHAEVLPAKSVAAARKAMSRGFIGSAPRRRVS